MDQGDQGPQVRLMNSLTISVDDAAAIFGIGRNAAYEAVKQGSIPSLRIGGRIMVPTARVREMLGLEARPFPVPASGGGK